METVRQVAFITLSESRPRAWVTLPGCNFRCRGCFSIAREAFGEFMSPDELVDLLMNSSKEYYGHHSLEEILLTGGEPTLDPEFLVSLVSKLNELTEKIVVQTNGYILDPLLTDRLIDSGLEEIICDIKAWNDEVHRWYTGRSNRPVLENIRYACERIKTTVNTLLIPDVVDVKEIEGISRFLASCHPIDMEYRINPFRSELSPVPVSRDPTEKELDEAIRIASMYLPGSVRSRSCLRESGGNGTTHWMTVFPDGRMERRSVDDYRERNLRLYGEKGIERKDGRD